MNNDELKKKILSIVRGATIEADELPFVETTDNIADALIAAGIGDIRETEHRAEVLRLALSKSVLDENAIFDDDVCRYILSNTKLTEEYYIEQAEKELAEEERKDE